MSAKYSSDALDEIASSVLEIYSPIRLRNLYCSFQWQKIVLPAAETKRIALSNVLVSAIQSGCLEEIKDAANSIHIWGFGHAIPTVLSVSSAFWNDLKVTLTAFVENYDNNTIYQNVDPLTNLLTHNRMGIATASKWICFLDQKRFAIFDSRVSIALRNVIIDGHRAFPVVGRRPTVGRLVWPTTPLLNASPVRTARAYVDYIQVMRRVSDIIGGMTPAQIEMALFMAGDVWPSNGEVLKPLIRGMWS